jgi:hypothetical protein
MELRIMATYIILYGAVGYAFIQMMLITSNFVCKLHLSDAIEPLFLPLLAGAMAARRRDKCQSKKKTLPQVFALAESQAASWLIRDVVQGREAALAGSRPIETRVVMC